ncbi:hypothetical protein Dda_7710 [Drechslerella dactyloides]|uniref:Uncharacterized protein n=1 Tax=Drechslerella dactyloides TaxID=74499 RepID=A0AAD6NGX8_DREDA|nr:hypothetical protein Dda_7710 [Drechslerella dactyloides]
MTPPAHVDCCQPSQAAARGLNGERELTGANQHLGNIAGNNDSRELKSTVDTQPIWKSSRENKKERTIKSADLYVRLDPEVVEKPKTSAVDSSKNPSAGSFEMFQAIKSKHAAAFAGNKQ